MPAISLVSVLHPASLPLHCSLTQVGLGKYLWKKKTPSPPSPEICGVPAVGEGKPKRAPCTQLLLFSLEADFGYLHTH